MCHGDRNQIHPDEEVFPEDFLLIFKLFFQGVDKLFKTEIWSSGPQRVFGNRNEARELKVEFWAYNQLELVS